MNWHIEALWRHVCSHLNICMAKTTRPIGEQLTGNILVDATNPIRVDHDVFRRTVKQSIKTLGYVHCQAFGDGTVW